MRVRAFDREKDADDIRQWWKFHSDLEVDFSLISNYGFIAESSTGKHCAMWVYLNGSRLAHMDGAIVNPHTGAHEKVEALQAMFNAVREFGITFGVVLRGCTPYRGLVRLMIKSGFTVTDAEPMYCVTLSP